MKRTELVRVAILAKYNNGQTFTSFNFEGIQGEGRISSILSIMKKKGFIEKIGNVKSDRKGCPPINQYKLTGTAHAIPQIRNQITLSQWHKYPDIPERDGIYEVMYFDNKKAKIEWNGKWHLPIPYIKGWRGIAR